MIMEIKNPKRILILGPPDSGALSLVKALTGSAPTPRPLETPEDFPPPSYTVPTSPPPTTAYVQPLLTLENAYYTARIPIWLDEVPIVSATSAVSAIKAWAADFQSADAREVVHAVGAWVVVFRVPAPPRALVLGLLEAVAAALKAQGVETDDVCLMAVGMPETDVRGPMGDEDTSGMTAEEIEDLCIECGGWEFVDGTLRGKNTFGEVIGIERIREALEANEWEAAELPAGEDEEFGDLIEGGNDTVFEEDVGFGLEREQMEREFADLRMAVQREDDEDGVESAFQDGSEKQVEELERMMLRVKAAKEMTAHLPTQEKEKMAARTVNEVMRSL